MVGIVIDDAICGPGKHLSFYRREGRAAFQRPSKDARNLVLPAARQTLSLLAVFLPVGFMGGIMARLCLRLVLTSFICDCRSLLVSFTLTPMLAARLIKRSNDPGKAPLQRHTEPSTTARKSHVVPPI